MLKKNKILILDFGSQYTHLIARRVRQLKVYSEIKEPDIDEKELADFDGLILSGGPHSVYDGKIKFNAKILELGKPVLGLCYSHNLLAHELGGKVKPGKVKEYGTARLEIKKKDKLFKGLEDEETVWMSHGDAVAELPENFEVIGSTSDCQFAAIACLKKDLYGLQFHPEVSHTPHGMKILENFIFDICHCQPTWTMESYLQEKIQEIQEKAKDKKIFLLASGGVDSTVVLALLDKALPQEKVYALHVDTGFMRKNESALVKEALEKLGYKNFHVVDASDYFFEKTKGLTDPEEKRQAIGQAFLEVQREELKKLGFSEEEWLLAQGTIYPDTIETARTKYADKIKTHHNRIQEIVEMIEEGKVLEPLDELYKDEVRELGLKLGLPRELVFRHPFPGPGLAIRCLCAETPSLPENLDEVEKKVNEIAGQAGLKAFILPVKSVGVQGDYRTFMNPVALSGKADWQTLESISTQLTNQVKAINRIVYCVHPEELKSITLKPGFLERERISLLRKADAIAMETVHKHDLNEDIWQFPVILIPVSVNGLDEESIVLRPIYSTEAMTAKFFDMEEKILQEIAEKILQLKGVGAVFFDVTHKPPATICWE